MTDREKAIKGLECCIDPLKARCPECPYYPCYDEDTTSEKLLTDALALLKEQEPTVSSWVSVKDRLPDKHCGCLVFNEHGWSALDCWEGYGWMLSDDPEVTHWMPLPEPPKEVTE